MKNLKIAISAPVKDNIYSFMVAKSCISEPGVEVVGVFALKLWSLKRIVNEFIRLRSRLLIKIWQKYFSESINEIRNDTTTGFSYENIDQEEANLESLCLKNSIPFEYFEDPNDEKAINFLEDLKPDVILSIGSVILEEQFLDVPKTGVLNVHMGILPEYRGIGVTEWPIIESSSLEDIKIGISLHIVERGVDTGPIILKKKIKIDQNDTIESIEEKFLPQMIEAMLTGVRLARDGKLKYQKQEQNTESRQYYFLHPRLRKKARIKLRKLINES